MRAGQETKSPKGEEEEKDVDKTFDPEKYEMTVCLLCQGHGKLAKTPDGFEACKECGSFGLTRRRNI
jgi:hypothetical protein